MKFNGGRKPLTLTLTNGDRKIDHHIENSEHHLLQSIQKISAIIFHRALALQVENKIILRIKSSNRLNF